VGNSVLNAGTRNDGKEKEGKAIQLRGKQRYKKGDRIWAKVKKSGTLLYFLL